MLTSQTRLVGILGHPVSHSLSPRMQNAAFAAAGLDWAYVPLPCEPDRLGDALPVDRLDVRIDGTGDEPRTITLIAWGDRYARYLEVPT